MTPPPDPIPTIDSLKRECHGLIERIAKKPGAIKLLLGIRAQCRVFEGYKKNRVIPKGARKRHDR